MNAPPVSSDGEFTRERRRIAFGVAGAFVFLFVALAEGYLRAGYDPWHQAVSALALGPRGWVQQLNFIIFGIAILYTVPAWRSLLAGGVGARAYPLLIGLTGAAFLVAAFVPQDPAPGYDPEGLNLRSPTATGLLHLGIAAVAALAAAIAPIVMARRVRGRPEWRGWAAWSIATSLALVACVAVYAVWSVRPSGYAGTFERLAVALPALWTCTFVLKLSNGSRV